MPRVQHIPENPGELPGQAFGKDSLVDQAKLSPGNLPNSLHPWFGLGTVRCRFFTTPRSERDGPAVLHAEFRPRGLADPIRHTTGWDN